MFLLLQRMLTVCLGVGDYIFLMFIGLVSLQTCLVVCLLFSSPPTLPSRSSCSQFNLFPKQTFSFLVSFPNAKRGHFHMKPSYYTRPLSCAQGTQNYESSSKVNSFVFCQQMQMSQLSLYLISQQKLKLALNEHRTVSHAYNKGWDKKNHILSKKIVYQGHMLSTCYPTDNTIASVCVGLNISWFPIYQCIDFEQFDIQHLLQRW